MRQDARHALAAGAFARSRDMAGRRPADLLYSGGEKAGNARQMAVTNYSGSIEATLIVLVFSLYTPVI